MGDSIKWLTTLGGQNAKCEGYRLVIVPIKGTSVACLRIRKHDGALVYGANHDAPTEGEAIDKAKADAQRMLKLMGVT
jgi:hypothetical protein